MVPFSNILFVTNLNTDDTVAFQQALRLAHDSQAKLSVAMVVEDSQPHATRRDKANAEVTSARSEELSQFVHNLAPRGMTIEVERPVALTVREVTHLVNRSGHDLVIKSSESNEHKKRRERLGFGNTDKKLLQQCPCCVWLVKPDKQRKTRKILLSLGLEPDDTELDGLNDQLLQTSTWLAIAEFNEMHVVHPWRMEHESFLRAPWTNESDTEVDGMVRQEELKQQRWFSEALASFCANGGREAVDYLNPQLHLVEGEARKVIPQCATDLGVDLVVLPLQSRTGLPGLFSGSTAHTLVDQLDCSILAVKSS